MLPSFDQRKLRRTYTPLARCGVRETYSVTITKDDIGDKYINQYKVLETIGR